jgi:hypothetical protein
LVAIGSGS